MQYFFKKLPKRFLFTYEHLFAAQRHPVPEQRQRVRGQLLRLVTVNQEPVDEPVRCKKFQI